MPVYVVEIDGKQYDIEGERPPSEQEARAAVASFAPAPKKATPPPASATVGMRAPSTAGGDPGGWAGRHLKPEMAAGLSQYSMDDVMAEPIGPNVIGAAKAAPGIIARGLGISKARAGQNMQAAAEAARDVPVTALDAVRAAAGRAGELQATGSRMPRVVTQLTRRISSDAPLSFKEAQDFVSNMSRLSANEFNALNPSMQRQVTEMAKALRGAVTEAAGTVGKGEQYAAGVKEYARASQAAKKWDAISPTLTSGLKRMAEAAGLGWGATVAYQAFRD